MPAVNELSSEQISHLKRYVDSLQPTWAGKFFYYCLPFRKRVILENIRLVFADILTDAQITRLAQSFYSHLASSLAENIKLRFMSRENIKARGEVRGYEKILAAAEQGKGVLILSGHFGNWEFAPIAGIWNFPEFRGRFHLVRKSIRMKWLENILFHRYFQAGLQVIPKKNSLQKVIDVLEQNDAVVFVMDQAASVDDRIGVPVKFFGHTAGTYKSLATLARMDIPVVPANTYRDKSGKHVLEFYDALPWQAHEKRQTEIELNTQNYNTILEKFVLSRPEQWFWMHRRWKPG